MAVLDVEAIERASKTEKLSGIVRYLNDQLGTQATAYIAGLKDAKMIARWLEGTDPRPLARHRLRYSYSAARMIREAYDTPTVEAWFFGSNSRLDDEAPAWLIRNAESVEDLRPIIPAAKAFARAPE